MAGSGKDGAMRLAPVAALLLVACTTSAKPASSSRFDGSPPCRVPVTEVRQDEDDRKTLRYQVELTRAAGGQLEVRLRDFQLLELNGEDMTTREHAAQAPGLLVRDALRPVVLIGDDGVARRAGAIEAERVAGELGLDVSRVLGLPDASDYLEDDAMLLWRAWVGAWAAWTLSPGESHEANVTLTLRRGGRLPARQELEHLGTVGAHVRLQRTDVLDADAVQARYSWDIHQLQQAALGAADAFETGSERTVSTVELDPVRLRPHRARLDDDLRLVMAESGERRFHTVRDMTFDWAHAKGCQR
jgi:hypothetical protein